MNRFRKAVAILTAVVIVAMIGTFAGATVIFIAGGVWWPITLTLAIVCIVLLLLLPSCLRQLKSEM